MSARTFMRNGRSFAWKSLTARPRAILLLGVVPLAVLVVSIINFAWADTNPQSLPLSQNWSNTNLITANDNWSGVPGIIGYGGNNLAAEGTNPQTVTADGSGTPVNVTANKTNPSASNFGGFTEFEQTNQASPNDTNPVVAFQGNITSDVPNLVLSLNTSGQSNVRVAYTLRDIDGGSNNATQPVALQYRVGNSGVYTNLPAGYVADATTGPNLDTKTTAVSTVLPAAANNQPLVQVRIITVNTTDQDEWIGIDDISVVNATPAIDLNGGGAGTGHSATFTEDGGAVAIVDAAALSVADADSPNLSSAAVTITNLQDGVAESLSAITTSTPITASYNPATGVLTLSGSATLAQYQQVLRTVRYNNTSQSPGTTARSVNFVVSDGTYSSNTATSTVAVNTVNDSPTLTATGTNPTYTENGAAADLFDAVNVSTVEAGQSIDRLLLTVGNVSGGVDEVLRIDGTDIALTNGNSVTTATNGMIVTVSLSGGTATVTTSKTAGISAAATQTLVDGMTYRHAGDNPTAGNRAVTLTSIRDTGGTANGGADTRTLNAVSTVTVAAANDAPVLALPGGPVPYAENAAPAVIDVGATVIDVDSANFDTGTLTVDFSAGGAADDRLAIRNGGTGNPISVSGNAVSFNGTQIGTFTGGTGATPLVVTFDADATQAAVQALARNITFANVSEDPSTVARTVRFVLTDGDGGTSAAVTETINVSATNDAPTVSDIADRTILEDTDTGDVAFTIGDPDSGALTLSGSSSDTTLVPNAGITFGGSGANRTVKVTPAANRSGGPVTITVTVSDGGQSATDTFQLTITPVNDAPSFDLPANPDQTVNEDAGAQTAANFATNVSAGPFETQDVTFEVTNNTNPSLFSAGPAIAPNGNLTYTPAANANGAATITVRARDDGGTANGGADASATRTFTINVNAVNDRPTADADGPYPTDEDTTLYVPANQGVLAGDADIENTTLEAELVSAPARGTLTLDDDGSFSYEPALNDSGDVTFTYRACEQGSNPKVCSDPATVTIRVNAVNDAPTIAAMGDRTILEDTDTGDIAFTVSDPDAAAGDLTLSRSSSNQTLVPDANVTFGGSDGSRTVKVTPAADRFGGPATITVTVSDGTGPGSQSATETFELTVTPVNDAPSFTKGADQTVAEDAGAQSVPNWATNISEGSFEDQDVNFLVENNDNGLFTPGGQPAVAPDGTLTYTPNANANGTAVVTVRAKDDGGTANDGADTSAPQTFTINVNAVNDAPSVTLTGGPATDAVDEGGTVYTFEFAVTDPDAGDGFEIKNGFPSCGTGGTLVGTPTTTATGGSFECRFPDGDATPTVSIRVTDGDDDSNVASRDLTVNNVDPTAADDAATANEDGPAVVIDVLGNDADPAGAGDPLEISIVDGPPTGQGTVEVFTDNGRQKVRFTPNPDFEGQSTGFTYRISDGDGGTSGIAAVTVTLVPANDAPVASDDSRTIAEDAPPLTVDLADLVSDAETSDENLAYTIVSGPTDAQGTLTQTGSSFTFDSADDFNGPVEVTYKVRDRGDPDDCGAANATCDAPEESAVKTVTIDVTSVNDAPVAQDQTLTPDEGATPTVTLSGSDRDGDDLTYKITRLPASGKLYEGEGTNGTEITSATNADPFVLDADKVTYVPDAPDFDGDDDFGFVAGDGQADSAPATVTLDYVPVNDAPVVTFTDANGDPAGDTQTVNEGQRRTYNYTVADVDGPASPDVTESCGDAPAVHEDTGAPGSFECLFPDGPETHTVSVETNDGESSANTGSDSVEVTVDNVKPTVTLDGPRTVQESTTEERSYAFTVTDPGDDGFEVDQDFPTCGDNGTLVEGSLDTEAPGYGFRCLFPDGDATSDVAIRVKDSDGAADTDEQVVTVTIDNAAPTATFDAPASVDEGDDIDLSLTNASDPAGGNDTHEYRFKCGDDNWTDYGTQSTHSCPTTDDGSVVVKGQVKDEDGGESEYQETVTVNNVEPVVTAPGGQSSDEGENGSFGLGSFADPGDDGPWSVSVDWGDGSPDTTFTAASPGPLGNRDHAYADGGGYTVTVTVSEAGDPAPFDSATFGVTVDNVAPTATLSNDGPIDEGSPATVSFSGQSDPSSADRDSLHYAFACDNGSLDDATYADSGTNASTTCPFDQDGSYTVRARVMDKDGGFTEYATGVTVRNVAPTAGGQSVETAEDTNEMITLAAGDPGGDELTYKITRLPASGKLYEGEGTNGTGITSATNADPFVLDADKVTYVPDADTNGDDSFEFRARDDDEAGNAATVSITVTEVNDPPEAGNDARTVAEDSGATSINVLGNDEKGPDNEDAQELRIADGDNDAGNGISLVSGPAHGTATVNGDGTISYTPDPDYNGSDAFAYKVCDDGTTDGGRDDGCDEGTVDVTVTEKNDAPTGANDTKTTPEDTPLVFPASDLVGNDEEGGPQSGPGNENAQNLTVTDVGNPSNGTVSLDDKGTAATGDDEITFTPTPDYSGPASFEYTVCDDGTTNGADDPQCEVLTARVNVTVTAVNDKPVVDLNGGAGGLDHTATFSEDDPSVSIVDSAALTVTDVDDANIESATVTLTNRPDGNAESLSVDLTGTTGITATPYNPSTGVLALGGTATKADYQKALRTVEYGNASQDPDTADRSVTFVVNDGDADSETATSTVTVEAVNDDPEITQVEATSPGEGSPATITVTVGDPDDPSSALSYEFDCNNNGVYEVGPQAANTAQCTYDDDGTAHTVNVRVTDGDGGEDTDSTTVTVNNVAPTGTLGDNGPKPEGVAVTVSFTNQSDPSSADTSAGFHYAFACDNGSLASATYANSGTVASEDCTFGDDGEKTVKARIMDKDGGFTEYTTTFDVTNVDPAVTDLANQNASEGTSNSFDLGSFTDPGTDGPWTATVNWGDGNTQTITGGPFDDPGSLGSMDHAYADSGSYTVTVKVAEEGAGTPPFGEGTFTANVANVAPVVTSGADQSSDEGDDASFDLGSFTDPGTDGDWNVTVDWGDGSADTTFTVPESSRDLDGETFDLGSRNHAYADNDSDQSDPDNDPYTVTVTVEEEGTGTPPSGSDTFEVTVNNVKPTVTLSGPDEVLESTTEERSYAFTVTDPGDDGFEVDQDFPTCGDNGTLVEGSLDTTAPGYGFRCLFPDGDATSDVAIRVKDDDGAADTDTEPVKVVTRVDNVAPTATFNDNGPINEGQSIELSMDNATDPAGTNDTLSYAFDCGSGYGPYGSSSTSTCPATTDDGPVAVKGKVRDEDGGETEYAGSVTVNNVAPTATLSNDGPRTEGSAVTVSFADQSDPSSADTSAGFRYEYRCDGTAFPSGPADYDGPNTTTDASTTCTFPDSAAYTVRARIMDEDGGAREYTTEVTVDEPPILTIDDVTVDPEGDVPGATNATFTVTRTGNNTNQSTVAFDTADGTAKQPGDYTETSGTLTFADDDGSETITVPVEGDALDEIDETFSVNLSGAANATISDGVGTGTISDDDAPPAISVTDVSKAEGDAGTTAFDFAVTIPESAKTVEVDYATADGTATMADNDYAAKSSTTLTFDPGQTSKTVTVDVNGDTNHEPNEDFSVDLSNPVEATISDDQGKGTVVNDDNGPPVIEDVESGNPVTGGGVDGNPVDEGSPSKLVVTATDPDGDDLYYSFDCNGDGDFDDPGDAVNTTDNTARCTFGNEGEYPVNVRVTDDPDDPGSGVTFEATVRVANVAATADDGYVGDVLEDGSGEVISLTGSDPGVNDVLVFSITSLPANGRLYKGNSTNAADEITSASVASPVALTGTEVTYIPDADANGPDSFGFFVSDGGIGTPAAGNGEVTVTVAAVNDAPGFTKGADQSVNEDSGAKTVAGWATSISKGPADESGQTVNFMVTNDNNGLFSVQPAISPNGTLTYTLAPDAFGTANITAILEDDGGTANGGVDESAARTFKITVNDVAEGARSVCARIGSTGEQGVIVGGPGDDTLRGTPGPNVIVGGPGNDTLRGTSGPDVIIGGAGNDTILGLGGADVLCGMSGVDKIDGGEAKDTVDGGIGNDTLKAGSGKAGDVLYGDAGDDKLYATDKVRGNDVLHGGEGVDTCDADAGDIKTGCP